MENDLETFFNSHSKTLFLSKGVPRHVSFSATFPHSYYEPIQMKLIEPYIELLIKSAKENSAELVYEIIDCSVNRTTTLKIGYSGHTVHLEYLKRIHYPSMCLRTKFKY